MFRYKETSTRVRQADGEITARNFYLPIYILVLTCLRIALVQAETFSIHVKQFNLLRKRV
jgi:uncharacterized membrane protein YecN with MAPEG domain